MAFNVKNWEDLPSEDTPVDATSLEDMETRLSNYSDSLVTSTALKLYKGSGSPEGVVTAAVGSIYQRSNGAAGTSLYVKQSGTGNTGWAAYAPATYAKGVLNHGTNATATRPAGYASIEWIGTVQPVNMIAGDTWWDTTP
jgi:hypothetical protein